MNTTKSTLSVLHLFFFSVVLNAQKTAITEDGDTIYIYNNGTWSFEYLEESPQIENLFNIDQDLVIDTISNAFVIPKLCDKSVSNIDEQFEINYNSKEWKRIPPGTLNEEAEFAFESKVSDVWAIVISEETQIDKEKLFLIAKNTMQESSDQPVEIIKSEILTINNQEVLRGVLKGSFSGIEFIFDSIYFSDEKGSVQFSIYTSVNLWPKYQEQIFEFQKGFEVK